MPTVSLKSSAKLGSILFVENNTNDYEYANIQTLPNGFGDAGSTLGIWFRCDDSYGFGDVTVDPNQWANDTSAIYSGTDSTPWWEDSNFLIDGHNNSGPGQDGWADGTFDLVFRNGRLFWLVGNGSTALARTGNVHGIGDYSAVNLVDGAWHQAHCVTEFSGADTIFRLYIDRGQVATETATSAQVNMATTYWDSWTGFPAGQEGWDIGAEKQAARQILGDYAAHLGEVSELSFFEAALSSAEIAALPTALRGTENYLVGLYKFMEQTGTTAADTLGSGGNITLNDGPTSSVLAWSTASPL